MKIARIAYTNTEPFFYHWPKRNFPLVHGKPRELGELALAGDIVAGPLPLVDCWRLEDRYERLGPWGIAAKEESGSVFLFSKRPIQNLNNAVIGVTEETSTSVMLLQVLIQEKFRNTVKIKRGMDQTDDAWLVIGDQAFLMYVKNYVKDWGFVADLATEWWNWQRLPFVFAEWVVKVDLDPKVRDRLKNQVETCLTSGLDALPEIALQHSDRLVVPADKIYCYLKSLIYKFGNEEKKSMDLFRQMVQKVPVSS